MTNTAMHPLWGHLALERGSRASLQDQIVDHFRDAVLSGRIPSGRRVPSSRQLSNVSSMYPSTIPAWFTVTGGGLTTRPSIGIIPVIIRLSAAFTGVRASMWGPAFTSAASIGIGVRWFM